MYNTYSDHNNTEPHILKLKDSLSSLTLTEKLKTDAGYNFECMYIDKASLTSIYRCRTCGCILFAGNNDERYEPNLRCPVCTEYKPICNYWTKEEIEIDMEKFHYINMLIYMKNINNISNIFSHILKFKNKIIKFDLYHDDKYYFKGLHLKIAIIYNNNIIRLKYNKYFDIPLSVSYYKSIKKIKETYKKKVI